MNPILLQKQLKENVNDLDDFYKDLKTWGDDMKKKDPLLKSSNSIEKPVVSNKKAKKNEAIKKKVSFKETEPSKNKIRSIDYSSWDKFDADAECEKIDYDENDDSELTDECDESLREQAIAEKEKGNKFVKIQKWDEAIACYTKAIDCYSLDPIFYANRALCYLKKANYAKTESDCTLSLKLDHKYVKAYQRRAAAREQLNKLIEAQLDLVKVLELEPNNTESSESLKKLRLKLQNIPKAAENNVQRPVSKFTASRNQRKIIADPLPKAPPILSADTSKPKSHWPSGDDGVIPVKAINKPAHLRSKKPLKRIAIKEAEMVEVEPVKETQTVKSHVVEKPDPKPNSFTLNTDDMKVIERKPVDNPMSKETKNNTNSTRASEISLVAPKNSVQFYFQWKQLNNIESQYNYMKLINAKELSNVFKESLDSDVFSEIVKVLAECYVKNHDDVYSFLVGLTEIKRFSALTIFMVVDDKKYMWKLVDYIKEHQHIPKEDVDVLIAKYEL